MKSLQKGKFQKKILVVSDLHLSAGRVVNNRRNFLEDFHYDLELVEFFEYYANHPNLSDVEIEIIINGDFLDFLAVPYVPFFDDEFWSEEAAMAKLKMMIEAHPKVFRSMDHFLEKENHKIVYIIGNHDAEMVFESLQKQFINTFHEKHRSRVSVLANPDGQYWPVEGVLLMHGHEYEVAHQFDVNHSIIADNTGRKFFIPPWGSYYVTRVINRFKEGRGYVNAVRPVNKFVINGLIYDSLYTLRFLFANLYYLFMVRFVFFIKQSKNWKQVLERCAQEMQLFKDFENMTEDFVKNHENLRALIVGHTHDATYREYDNGATFINTGTWTKMYYLDFSRMSSGPMLTFAQVDVYEKTEQTKKYGNIDVYLNVWKGKNDLPFHPFH